MSNKNPADPGSRKRTPAARGGAVNAAVKIPPDEASVPARPKSPRFAARKAATPAKTTKPPEASKSPEGGKAARPSPKVRPQLVRDSFTMPEADFAFIATLKSRALDARRAAKKSELLRAGLRLLATLDSKALVAALDKLEPIKTGRPRKGH
jgi:hypothetical protein